MTRFLALLLLAAVVPAACAAAPTPPQPYGPIPSPRQFRHAAREFYAFCHFTVDTFTDKEWGGGDEKPSVFNPTAFDAAQIVGTLKAAGCKGVILTCKHHDGFCLWPTKATTHNVSASPFRGGKGDVVREMSQACHQAGVEFGVYLSPWDRNNPHYGQPEYVTQVYRKQMKELLTGYGPIFEVWMDGANGGSGYYGGAGGNRNIDRSVLLRLAQHLGLDAQFQPDAVLFSDVGPDLRWCGNESGYCGDPCWNTYTPQSGDPHSRPCRALYVTEKASTASATANTGCRPKWTSRSAPAGSGTPVKTARSAVRKTSCSFTCSRSAAAPPSC